MPDAWWLVELPPATYPPGKQCDAITLKRMLIYRPCPSAHTVLCEAIVFGGAPNLVVVLHELRARVRTFLNLWVEAREDVQVALKGLQQGQGDQAHDMDSEEERMEVRGRCIDMQQRRSTLEHGVSTTKSCGGRQNVCRVLGRVALWVTHHLWTFLQRVAENGEGWRYVAWNLKYTVSAGNMCSNCRQLLREIQCRKHVGKHSAQIRS